MLAVTRTDTGAALLLILDFVETMYYQLQVCGTCHISPSGSSKVGSVYSIACMESQLWRRSQKQYYLNEFQNTASPPYLQVPHTQTENIQGKSQVVADMYYVVRPAVAPSVLNMQIFFLVLTP